jgi:diguanylate cyclase (GGDEF)-like protein
MNRHTAIGLRFTVLTLLYVLGAAVADRFIVGPEQMTLIWAPAGLAFAALLVYGIGWWPFIAAAVVLLHLTLSPAPWLFIPFSVAANVISAVVAAWLLRRYAPFVLREMSIRSGFALLVGGLIQALLGAPIGVAGLSVNDMLGHDPVIPALARWIMGDLFGIIAVGPLAMLVMLRMDGRYRDLHYAYARWPEKVLWSLCMFAALALQVVLGERSPNYALGLACVPLAMSLWSALRFEPTYAALANLVLAQTIVTLAGLGLGGFTLPGTALDSGIVVLFICTFTLMPQLLVAVVHENRAATLHMVRRATTDPLTQLPNRLAFEQRCQQVFATQEPDRRMALAYIDLDQFKVVNDIASHAAGDELVRVLAGTLRSVPEGDEVLARIGGDEFGLLLFDDADATQARMQAVCEHAAELRVPWGEHVLSTTISIGVVPFRNGEQPFAQLFAQADAACFTAKELGGNRVQLATREGRGDGKAVQARTAAMHWAMRLNAALDKNHFRLYCQSIVALNQDNTHGRHFEVLVRMRSPQDDKLLLPGEFIPAAERFHLASRLDQHVLDRTLNWLESHPRAASGVESCAINLAAASVISPDFERYLQRRIASSSVTPSKLCFELTETSAVRDLARAQHFIETVRGMGCRFALDDFGTGFCSFAYLHTLDVDYFKIDGSFVRRLTDSPLALQIVRAIADIAKVMNKRTIAEFVETDAIRSRLAELGVDFAQGHAIDRPMPIDDYFNVTKDNARDMAGAA